MCIDKNDSLLLNRSPLRRFVLFQGNYLFKQRESEKNGKQKKKQSRTKYSGTWTITVAIEGNREQSFNFNGI